MSALLTVQEPSKPRIHHFQTPKYQSPILPNSILEQQYDKHSKEIKEKIMKLFLCIYISDSITIWFCNSHFSAFVDHIRNFLLNKYLFKIYSAPSAYQAPVLGIGDITMNKIDKVIALLASESSKKERFTNTCKY